MWITYCSQGRDDLESGHVGITRGSQWCGFIWECERETLWEICDIILAIGSLNIDICGRLVTVIFSYLVSN